MCKSINPTVQTLLEAYLRQDNVKIELCQEKDGSLAFIIKEGDDVVMVVHPLDYELRLISCAELKPKQKRKRGLDARPLSQQLSDWKNKPPYMPY